MVAKHVMQARGKRKEDLTDFQCLYCEYRSMGFTKAAAARAAGSVSKEPSRVGWEIEQYEVIRETIQQLKEDRAAAFALDENEQIRKYFQIWQKAVQKMEANDDPRWGTLAVTTLERINEIGGFSGVNKSEVTIKHEKGESLKDNQNVEEDAKKFASVLQTHEPKKDSLH